MHVLISLERVFVLCSTACPARSESTFNLFLKTFSLCIATGFFKQGFNMC